MEVPCSLRLLLWLLSVFADHACDQLTWGFGLRRCQLAVLFCNIELLYPRRRQLQRYLSVSRYFAYKLVFKPVGAVGAFEGFGFQLRRLTLVISREYLLGGDERGQGHTSWVSHAKPL